MQNLFLKTDPVVALDFHACYFQQISMVSEDYNKLCNDPGFCVLVCWFFYICIFINLLTLLDCMAILVGLYACFYELYFY